MRKEGREWRRGGWGGGAVREGEGVRQPEDKIYEEQVGKG